MENNKERFAELDVMRFFAALSVVLFHYKSLYVQSLGDSPALAHAIYSATKFGYLGVDLFFMISGFVIFCSALNRSAFQFSVSRITRIYPTLWVCVLLTVGTALVMEGPAAGITLSQVLANLALLESVLGLRDVDGVYWTLIVEMRFYLCVAALLILGILGQYRVWIPLWLMATMSFLAFGQPFFLGWFVSPEYSANFIAGITFYLARRDGYRPFHVAILLPAMACSAYFAYQAVDTFTHEVTGVDRIVAAAIVCGMYLVFFLVSIRAFTVLPGAFVLGLGGVTYPLYLLHNRAGKDIYNLLSDTLPSLALLAMITAVMLLASSLIHVYLERRIADKLKFQLFALAGRITAIRGTSSVR